MIDLKKLLGTAGHRQGLGGGAMTQSFFWTGFATATAIALMAAVFAIRSEAGLAL